MAVGEQRQTELGEIIIDDPDLRAALREYADLAQKMKPFRARRTEIKAMALRRGLSALPKGTETGKVRVGEFQLSLGQQAEETISSKRKAGPTLQITEPKPRGRPRKETTEDGN